MVKEVSKTKNSHLNSSTTLKKRVLIQQTQTNPRFNSTIKDLKGSNSRQAPSATALNPTVKRNVLPAITKKPTSIIALPRIRTPSSTVISETPSSIQSRLPPIKDHVIKHNLTLRATLKCKTPRPGSSHHHHHRSNTVGFVEPDEQTKLHHPLQKMDVASLLTESARNRLKRLFKKLDTDQDGHLLYTEVQRCLPPNLPRAQLTFFHVLYNIISNGTFFGLQEFYTIAVIVEIIAKQDSTLWNHFLDDVDFNYYHATFVQFIEEFSSHCSANRGTISYEILLQFIAKRTKGDQKQRISNELEYLVPKIKTMKINPLDFLALLPTIIYIQSSINTDRALFRFKDNSLMDFHMRQALRT